MKVFKTLKETTADGPGVRYAVYVSGCEHHCKGCHNPQTWDFEAGTELDIYQIKAEIAANSLLDGLTVSGGEPLHPRNVDGTLRLLSEFQHMNIWLFTGYLYEDIQKDPKQSQCLQYVDVLVDGPYVESERILEDIDFRGSANQRILHVKKLEERTA